MFFLILSLFLLSLSLSLFGGVYFFRKQSLVTDVYAHIAFPSVILSYLVVGSLNLLSIFGFSLLLIFVVDFLMDYFNKNFNISYDFLFSSFLAIGFSLGIILLNILQNLGVSTKSEFSSFLFGNFSSLTSFDLYLVTSLSFITFVFLWFFRSFIYFYLFDPQTFEFKFKLKKLFDLIFRVLLILLTVLSLKIAGVVLTTGLFLIPYATASLFSNKVSFQFFFLLPILFLGSIFSVYLSTHVSGLATGPILIFTYFILYLLSFIFLQIKSKKT